MSTRDWAGELGDNPLGITFLRYEAGKVYYEYKDFDFSSNAQAWPPAKVSEQSCSTPTEFCKYRIYEIHGDRYELHRVKYAGPFDHVTLICKDHGEFSRKRRDIYQHKSGCPKCSTTAKSLSNKSKALSKEDFKDKASKVHKLVYDYSDVEYISNNVKVGIICKQHGVFSQTPNSHLRGSGCPSCVSGRGGWWSLSTFKGVAGSRGRDGNANLYLIRCEKGRESFYKIGITLRSISTRFRSKILMPYDYTICDLYSAPAEEVYKLEKALHREFKHMKYTPKIEFGGMTECFSLVDITKYREIVQNFKEVVAA